jgi:hypothetical protein
VSRILGIALNLALRAAILAFLADALVHPDDPRFADKAIGTRGLLIVPLTLLVPIVHLAKRRGEPYPAWMDSLYLSIFAVDLGGNVLDLYNRFTHFDLVPHTHGTGAVTVFLAWVLRRPMLSAIGLATILHVLLEAQEYYSDVLFGLANVRGTWDVVNDLVVGIIGSVAYSAAYLWLRRGRARSGR